MTGYKRTPSLFIGETLTGVSSPVFFDTHTALYNKGLPVINITGSPGQGKTFAGLSLTALAAKMGKTIFAIDYKGDLLSIANLKMDGHISSDVNVWNLQSRDSRGLLDPFFLSNDDSEILTMTIELINIFVGGLDRSYEREVYPVVADVVKDHSKPRSLMAVVQELRGSQSENARDIGAQLHSISNMKYANLCFYTGRRKSRDDSLKPGSVTIATLSGMELPRTDTELTSKTGRLSSGILYLLTNHVSRLMMQDESPNPKVFVVDEAWAILSTKQGASTIQSTALLGRSKNLVTVLITQSPTHFSHLPIDNTVGMWFAFRGDDKESADIARKIKLPEDEGFDELIASLEPQQCLFSDWSGNFSIMRFSSWKKDWARSFETNPYELAKRRESEQ